MGFIQFFKTNSLPACKKPYPSECLSSVAGHPYIPSYLGLTGSGALNQVEGITAFWGDSYLVGHMISFKKLQFR